jgi:hypothetical protein
VSNPGPRLADVAGTRTTTLLLSVIEISGRILCEDRAPTP